MLKQVHLGFEVGTGEEIEIPLRNLAVTGQTQESGKMISEDFFANARTSADVANELGRRGFNLSNIELGNELKALTQMGFFTRDNKWISLVPGMKVNVIEA